ncbi:MAG: hypothetical protein Kow00127_18560 [Bacteroidales bacterium]
MLAICAFVVSGLTAQEVLQWRLARPMVVPGTPDLFQFDVEVSATNPGTYHRDLQVYLNYNTAAFGSDISASGAVTVSKLELLDNPAYPSATYSIVNVADNSSSRIAILTEADNELTQPGTSAHFIEIPDTYTGLFRIQIEIADPAQLAGIGFESSLMDGGQYYQDAATTDPVKYAASGVYGQTLMNTSLQGIELAGLKCYIEGPYTGGGTMSTSLLSSGYLPLNQPYNPSLPYYGNSSPVWLYAGTESVSSFPANTVDWVLVQLRDAVDVASAGSGTIIGTQACLLLDDGSVVNTSGNPVVIKQAYTNNLFVVIYHRNHLGVISNYSPGLNSDGNYTYDFSTAADQAYGGANGHKDLGGGIFGMVAADGNGNGLIQNDDETNAWKVDLGSSGYLAGDFDMNGLCQNTDETNFWKVNLGGGGQVPAKANQGYQSQIPK